MKISTMIISMLLASLFVATFGSYYANIQNNYGSSMDASTNVTLEGFDQFAEIDETVVALNNTLFTEPTGFFQVDDLVGKFLGAGFQALKIARQSFGAMTDLILNSVQAIPGLDGAFGTILIAIALVVVLFAIISALVGKDI